MGFINLSMLCVSHRFSMNEFLVCLFESLMKILTSLSLLLQNIMRNTDLMTAPHQGLLPGLLTGSLSHVCLPDAAECSFLISLVALSQAHSTGWSTSHLFSHFQQPQRESPV